jgi:uncharacterized protein YbjT (DUF2867 family)
VRAGIRQPTASQRAEDNAVAFDVTHQASFAPALAGIERMFLMRPPAVANVAQTLFPLIDAAKSSGVKQIVFLSLLGAEKLAFVPHRKVEIYLQQSGLAYTFLRASFFMQNLQTAHRQEIRDRHEILVPAGNGKTSFIDVNDIAAVAVRALIEPGHAGKAYDLTGAEALDYPTVAAMLSLVMGYPVVYRHPSLRTFLIYQRSRGVSAGQALVMAAIYTTTRLGMADRITGDVAQLLKRPAQSLQGYLAQNRQIWLA